MAVIQEISTDAALILIMIIGILGLILSFFLILAPERLKTVSRRLDYGFNLDDKLTFLDSGVKFDHFIYRHPVGSGIVLCFCALFLLFLLFFKVDAVRLSQLFSGGGNAGPMAEIVITSLILIGKTAGIIGVILSGFLVFAVDSLVAFEKKMASGMSTQPLVDTLNRSHDGIDAFFIRYPVLLGMAGLGASVLLIMVSSLFFHRG